MAPSVASDEDLIRAYASNDASAFDELYMRYKDPLFKYCLFMLRNRSKAEDLLQRVFMKCIVNSNVLSKKKEMRFKPWIYQVTANLCKDEFKRSENRLTVSVDEMNHIPSQEDGHEKDLEKRELEGAIDQAITVLPEKARQVIGLHYYSGMDHAEIADVLGIPLGTVKSRMSKASEILARLLKGLRP